jgi:hypothetical protein
MARMCRNMLPRQQTLAVGNSVVLTGKVQILVLSAEQGMNDILYVCMW